MAQRTLHLSILIPLALLLFAVNIGGYDLWPADEPRFGEAAREMMQSGDYLSPRVNGEPYLEKPPLLFWSMALVAAPFGDMSESTARIPSVASGVLTALLTYLLAARLFGARTAFWSALILITGFRFWWQARTAQIDMLLTACTTTTLYALWRWDEERRARWLAALYLALAAALFAKGPPGPVFFLLFVWTFYRQAPAARKQLHWVAGLACVGLLGLLWFIPARLAAAGAADQAAGAGMAANFFRNTIGRFLLGVSKAQPPWYYLTTLPVDLMPWALFLPWILPWTWKRRGESRALRFLLCWTVPALIFFSISIGKRAVYILPLFPAFAILSAAAVLALMDGPHPTWRQRTGLAWALLLLLLGALPLALPFTPYREAAGNNTLFFGLSVLLFGGYALRRVLKTGGRSLHALIASQMAAVLFLAACCALPVINPYKSARYFCEPVRRLAEAGQEFRLYSVGFSREEYIFYSKHFHTPVLTDLVGKDEIPPEAWMEAAKQQKSARKLIARAVDAVAIANLEAVTAPERAALLDAIESSIAAEAEDAEALRAFEDALRREIDAFAGRFAAPEPAFLFVQDEDWRWLLPLHGSPPEYHVIRHDRVGSREVLLLANAAGEALCQSGR